MSNNQNIPVQPLDWLPAKGYTNGLIASGKHVYIAGQVGWNPQTCAFDKLTFIDQLSQALRNMADVLKAAGAHPSHLVRMTWFITSKADYVNAQRDIGKVYREVLGRHFPAMSVVFVSELVEDNALVEIEATAVIPE